MIPAISPPTDSLYKLMAIFGLGLLVLSVINTTSYNDKFMDAKVEIETIQHVISDSLYKYGELSDEFEAWMRNEELNSMNAEEMSEALENLESYIFELENLPGNVKTYISSQLDTIQIKNAVSENQKSMNYYLILFSALLMLLGFLLWYIKDQRWIDLKRKNEIIQKAD